MRWSLREPARRWQARQVLLFSGHRVDQPGRAAPRFPQDKAELAGKKFCQLVLPFRAPEFIDRSIMPCASGEE